jgi:hypothetical protein
MLLICKDCPDVANLRRLASCHYYDKSNIRLFFVTEKNGMPTLFFGYFANVPGWVFESSIDECVQTLKINSSLFKLPSARWDQTPKFVHNIIM